MTSALIPSIPPVWETTRTPALVSAPVGNASQPSTAVDVTDAVGLAAESKPLIYSATSWNNGPTSLAYLGNPSRFAVRFSGDGGNIYFLNHDGTPVADGAASLPINVSCPDVNMTFTFSQLAAVPPGGRARYAVVGACTTGTSVAEGDGPPLLVLLDEQGVEVTRIDPFQALGLARPSFVASVTTGKHAGALALLNAERGLVVFRVR
jgi:hypothetical protein